MTQLGLTSVFFFIESDSTYDLEPNLFFSGVGVGSLLLNKGFGPWDSGGGGTQRLGTLCQRLANVSGDVFPARARLDD